MRKFIILICMLAHMVSFAQKFEQIDSLLGRYNSNKTPGASLAIIENGKISYEKSFGMADLENNLAISSATNFRLASITKQFTATAILLLVHQQKFSLESTLTDLFPDFPTYGKRVTVKQLLNHTSGLVDYENYVADTAMTPQITDDGVLEIVKKVDTLYFEPGTKFQYSNTAYALLALIIENYSGMPYASFLKQSIFDPLKMNSTIAFKKGGLEVKNRAFGYSKRDGKWQRRDQSSTSAVLGDGGIYSNIDDLFKWDQSLYTDKILPKHLMQAATSYQKLTNLDVINYGFGWHLKKSSANKQVIYHTGSTTSFRNVFYRIPEDNFSIILLTNRNELSENDILTKAEQIADIWFKK